MKNSDLLRCALSGHNWVLGEVRYSSTTGRPKRTFSRTCSTCGFVEIMEDYEKR